MLTVLQFVKITAIIQICLIISSVFLIYFTHMFFVLNQRHNIKILKKLDQLFDLVLKNTKVFNANDIKFCKKHIYGVLTILNKLENTPHLDILITQLIYEVFIPIGRRYHNAYTWYKRYIATQCYLYGYAEEDRPYIQKLILDNVSLVSINAGKISVKFEDTLLTNTMIDVVARKRRLQQSVYINLILKSNKDISFLLAERLQQEKNIYSKIACYKLLAELTPKNTLISSVYADTALNNADLDIAIITYVMNSQSEEKNQILFKYAADNTNPNVKTIVAKMLGNVETQQSYDLLKTMLHDSNWWVRFNAATSLKYMGDRGIAILKKQSPETDKYAYEIAKYVLT